VTDSETFYSSILELLEDPDERSEVTELLMWWNRCPLSVFHAFQLTDDFPLSQIFPNHATPSRAVSKNSALARIKARRAAQKGQAQS
jgi:hypothetical protein